MKTQYYIVKKGKVQLKSNYKLEHIVITTEEPAVTDRPVTFAVWLIGGTAAIATINADGLKIRYSASKEVTEEINGIAEDFIIMAQHIIDGGYDNGEYDLQPGDIANFNPGRDDLFVISKGM